MVRISLLLFFILVIALPSCQEGDSKKQKQTLSQDSISLLSSDTATLLLEEEIAVFDSSNYKFVDGNLELSWSILAQVEFDEKYSEEVQAYVPYPNFAPIVKALDGKEISIQGYLIPVDESGGTDESILVLSANPFSSCFFCGAAGPESVMDIMLKEKIKGIKTDKIATFKGRLKLNDSDLYYLNYILEDATLVNMK